MLTETRTKGTEEELSLKNRYGHYVGAFIKNELPGAKRPNGELMSNSDPYGTGCVETLGLYHISGDDPRYTFLGGGHSRTAWFDGLSDVVIKTRDQTEAREGNGLEYAAWKLLSKSAKRKLLCPIASISSEGDVLRMQPARSLAHDEMVIEVNSIFQYYRRDNFGWIQISPTIERLVSVDYADIDLEGEFHDYIPQLSQRPFTGEPPFVSKDVRMFKIGECRNIHTFERCDEEGKPLKDHPKTLYAAYCVRNKDYIENLESVMLERGVSKAQLRSAEKAYARSLETKNKV